LPDLTTYLGFVAAVLMVQAVPGPDTILVAVRGMASR
jgi:threonine/homoserine/homoserine lactone efflux protein